MRDSVYESVVACCASAVYFFMLIWRKNKWSITRNVDCAAEAFHVLLGAVCMATIRKGRQLRFQNTLTPFVITIQQVPFCSISEFSNAHYSQEKVEVFAPGGSLYGRTSVLETH